MAFYTNKLTGELVSFATPPIAGNNTGDNGKAYFFSQIGGGVWFDMLCGGMYAPVPAFGGIPVPVNTVAPVVSGTGVLGEMLSVTTGTWINGVDSYSYQWERDGTPIAGATANTYKPVSADASTAVSCVVTATNAGGSADAVSNGIAVSNAWNPSVILTELWLDGADSATILHVGGLVYKWSDKSTVGTNHAEQSTGIRQPLTNTYDINGINAVSYDNDTLIFPAIDLLGKSAFSVFDNNAGAFNSVLLGNTIDNVQFRKEADNSIGYAAATPYYPSTKSAPKATNIPSFEGWILDTDINFSIDGTYLASGSGNNGSGMTTINQLGMREAVLSDSWHGLIGEVVIPSTAISVATRQKLEGYLAWKWGMESKLPVGHPYKSSSPTV